jgi:dTDP-glucose 4,6-dehydratase
LYVEDHVRGIDLVIRKGVIGETYNIGGNEEHANLDIVNRLCASIDDVFAADDTLAQRFPNAPAASGAATSSLITMVKDRPGHDWRYAVDAGRIHTELGYEPAHDFASGLRRTVDWMLANEEWWRGILDDSYRSWIEDQYVTR